MNITFFSAAVCSCHFDEDSIQLPLKYRLLNFRPQKFRDLAPNAVPTKNLPGDPSTEISISQKKASKAHRVLDTTDSHKTNARVDER